jgi:hypothetical protein
MSGQDPITTKEALLWLLSLFIVPVLGFIVLEIVLQVIYG